MGYPACEVALRPLLSKVRKTLPPPCGLPALAVAGRAGDLRLPVEAWRKRKDLGPRRPLYRLLYSAANIEPRTNAPSNEQQHASPRPPAPVGRMARGHAERPFRLAGRCVALVCGANEITNRRATSASAVRASGKPIACTRKDAATIRKFTHSPLSGPNDAAHETPAPPTQKISGFARV